MPYLLLDSIFFEGLHKFLGEIYACVRLVEPARCNVSTLIHPSKDRCHTIQYTYSSTVVTRS